MQIILQFEWAITLAVGKEPVTTEDHDLGDWAITIFFEGSPLKMISIKTAAQSQTTVSLVSRRKISMSVWHNLYRGEETASWRSPIVVVTAVAVATAGLLSQLQRNNNDISAMKHVAA